VISITRQDLIEKISLSIKLLRTEYGYSQQEMANSIGLSKKTLIQIEKGRLTLSWCATCAVCAVYRDSRQLSMELGEDPVNLIETLAHGDLQSYAESSNRNYVFWDVLEESSGFILAKNILTEHYKVTDATGKRYCSSFDLKKITAKYNDLIKKETGK
jgi:DNA-binding XRE family transcriptional regulator